MDAHWRLEKQTVGAGRKSVVSPLEYRGDERGRGGLWGEDGEVSKAEVGSGLQAFGAQAREKTYEINFFFSFPPPYFPLCHLREVSQCCCGGTQPCCHY